MKNSAGFIINSYEEFNKHLPAMIYNENADRTISVFFLLDGASHPSLMNACEERNWSFYEYTNVDDLWPLCMNIDFLHTDSLALGGHALQAMFTAYKSIFKSTKPAVISLISDGVFSTKQYSYILDSVLYKVALDMARSIGLDCPLMYAMYTETDADSMRDITKVFFPNPSFTNAEPYTPDFYIPIKAVAAILRDMFAISRLCVPNDAQLAANLVGVSTVPFQGGINVFSFYDQEKDKFNAPTPTEPGIYIVRCMFPDYVKVDSHLVVSIYRDAGNPATTWIAGEAEVLHICIITNPVPLDSGVLTGNERIPMPIRQGDKALSYANATHPDLDKLGQEFDDAMTKLDQSAPLNESGKE